MSAVVIGVGNPWRRDDGIGHAVVEALRDHVDPGVELVAQDGEAARLIDAWDGADLAVVVDAVRAERPPGTVITGERRSGASTPESATSSHGLGLDTAVELARNLGRLPRRLVVVGVVGVDFSHGTALTAAVEDAVSHAVDAVRAALRAAADTSRC